jgi:PEGA domain
MCEDVPHQARPRCPHDSNRWLWLRCFLPRRVAAMGNIQKALVMGTALALSGCGALMHGGSQTVDVESTPSGAKVETLPNMGTFITPTKMNLVRKHSYVLTVSSPGYTPGTFNIRHRVGIGTVIADILLGGLISVTVDGITGSWYGLSPETANVVLTKIGAGTGPNEIRVFATTSRDGGIALKSDTSLSLVVTVDK